MFGVAMRLLVPAGIVEFSSVPLRRWDVRDFSAAAVFDGGAFRLHGFYAVIAFHGVGCGCKGGGR